MPHRETARALRAKADRLEERAYSKKPLEFAQRLALLITISSILLVVATIVGNFILLWFGKQPMEQETITTITIFGGVVTVGATSVYSALTAIRACSANKYNMDFRDF